jgi:hypothetical protein
MLQLLLQHACAPGFFLSGTLQRILVLAELCIKSGPCSRGGCGGSGGDRIETGCMVLMLDNSSVTFYCRIYYQLTLHGYQLGYEIN